METPEKAIKEGFKKAEDVFLARHVNPAYLKLRRCSTNHEDDKSKRYSGSCATIAMIINKICYIANVGDSRILLCSQQSKSQKLII